MGLIFQPNEIMARADIFALEKKPGKHIIALAGNPNTGKSTVFNSLTGLNQHTGNWPGKTVTGTRGEFTYHDSNCILVDLPGTYSLFASSVEEEVARDFICFGPADAVIVVADATCLERNLNLVYQVMELTPKVVLCINLIDEARKKNIVVDARGIAEALGIPVVLCAARSGIGIEDLKETVCSLAKGYITPQPQTVLYHDFIESKVKVWRDFLENNHNGGLNSRWLALRLLDGDDRLIDSLCANTNLRREDAPGGQISPVNFNEKIRIRDGISEAIYLQAEEITNNFVKKDKHMVNRDRIIDNYVTSKIFGFPLMFLVLAAVFWITISGANYPSVLLANTLFCLEDKLTLWFSIAHAPDWLHGILVLGVFRTLIWVISVMLPPMAIFFPLFTLLEDLGYLPRVAFNMDYWFKKARAHGKQCLTMCMGFGCNAAGVTACRIIESPRERIIAVLTNNFVPCNGRFPALIAISSVFLLAAGKSRSSLITALMITGLVIIGIAVTLLVSYGLSRTILKGVPSSFTLELPPYRAPQLGRVLYTSLIDRSIFVLWRAVIVAAPAGAVIWGLGNIYLGNSNIISHLASILDPAAKLIGLDGFILISFALGLPANEIVLPILLMSYLSTGSMIEFASIQSLVNILLDNGWTSLTALNFMLFSLLHWPCSTTLLTIKKETGSLKWAVLAAFIPTIIAITICAVTALLFRAIGWGL